MVDGYRSWSLGQLTSTEEKMNMVETYKWIYAKTNVLNGCWPSQTRHLSSDEPVIPVSLPKQPHTGWQWIKNFFFLFIYISSNTHTPSFTSTYIFQIIDEFTKSNKLTFISCLSAWVWLSFCTFLWLPAMYLKPCICCYGALLQHCGHDASSSHR